MFFYLCWDPLADFQKLSSALGCHDTSEMRSALRQDEEDISTVLLDMIASDAIKNDILELQGEEAENMLSLIHNVSLRTMQPYVYS